MLHSLVSTGSLIYPLPHSQVTPCPASHLGPLHVTPIPKLCDSPSVIPSILAPSTPDLPPLQAPSPSTPNSFPQLPHISQRDPNPPSLYPLLSVDRVWGLCGFFWEVSSLLPLPPYPFPSLPLHSLTPLSQSTLPAQATSCPL